MTNREGNDAARDRTLQELVGGDLDPGSDGGRAALEADPELRREYESLRELEERVRDASGRSAAATRTAGLAREREDAFVAAAARPRGGRTSRWMPYAAAAAGIALVVGAWAAADLATGDADPVRGPDAGDPGAYLGTDDGAPGTLEPFTGTVEWSPGRALPPFELWIYDLESEDAPPVLHARDLAARSWTYDADAHPELPSSFRVVVEGQLALGGRGTVVEKRYSR